MTRDATPIGAVLEKLSSRLGEGTLGGHSSGLGGLAKRGVAGRRRRGRDLALGDQSASVGFAGRELPAVGSEARRFRSGGRGEAEGPGDRDDEPRERS